MSYKTIVGAKTTLERFKAVTALFERVIEDDTIPPDQMLAFGPDLPVVTITVHHPKSDELPAHY